MMWWKRRLGQAADSFIAGYSAVRREVLATVLAGLFQRAIQEQSGAMLDVLTGRYPHLLDDPDVKRWIGRLGAPTPDSAAQAYAAEALRSVEQFAVLRFVRQKQES